MLKSCDLSLYQLFQFASFQTANNESEEVGICVKLEPFWCTVTEAQVRYLLPDFDF